MLTITHMLLLSALGTAPWPQQSPQASARRPADPPRITEPGVLTAFERVSVRTLQATGAHQLLRTRINGQEITLRLTPYSLRTANFELWIQDATGGLRKLDAPPASHTYRGVVDEWERSLVAASFVNGKLTAMIRTAEHGNWFIQPADRGDADGPGNAEAGDHIAYEAGAVINTDHQCGVTPAEEDNARARRPIRLDKPPGGRGEDEGAGPRGGPADTEISFDADFEFFLANGSSVEATVDDIETVMVGIDAIYRSEVAIKYVVNRIIVRTSEPDPYTATDSNDLLDQFREEWEDHHGGQERDVAHLMSGKDFDGTIIGRAFIAEVCYREGTFDDGGYGISQSRFSSVMARRFAVTAHELGHNWDATHCDGDGDCGIMCSVIGGCSGSLTQFGSAARGEINDFRDSSDCLGGYDSTVYVDDSNNSGSEDGSPSEPYNTLREGLWAAEAGGTLMLFGGNYDFERTARILNRPVTLRKQPGSGTVLIGQ